MYGIDRLRSGRPTVMGILNVTPDSFSDGGSYMDRADALSHAMGMVDDGAAIIDVGAESTRPGFSRVSEREESERLIPVIRAIREVSDTVISADTSRASVARAAIDAGADMINDVNALRDPGMAGVLAEAGTPAVIVHCPFDLVSVHDRTMVGDPIPQIRDFLLERVSHALDSGMGRDAIILDPGIGFGKTMGQNMEVLNRFSELGVGYPLLAAVSRKRFLSVMYPGLGADDATEVACLTAIRNGADIVRVHDTGRIVRAIQSMKA